MTWQINYQGATLDEREVTAAHLMVIGDIIGEHSCENANPMHSPRTLTAWVALVALQAAKDEPLDIVLAYVSARPVGELIAAVTNVDDGQAPESPTVSAPSSLVDFTRRAV